MTVHTAFTGFLALEPGGMIFLSNAAPLAVGDELDLTLGWVEKARLTVTGRSGNSLSVVEEGR